VTKGYVRRNILALPHNKLTVEELASVQVNGGTMHDQLHAIQHLGLGNKVHLSSLEEKVVSVLNLLHSERLRTERLFNGMMNEILFLKEQNKLLFQLISTTAEVPQLLPVSRPMALVSPGGFVPQSTASDTTAVDTVHDINDLIKRIKSCTSNEDRYFLYFDSRFESRLDAVRTDDHAKSDRTSIYHIRTIIRAMILVQGKCPDVRPTGAGPTEMTNWRLGLSMLARESDEKLSRWLEVKERLAFTSYVVKILEKKDELKELPRPANLSSVLDFDENRKAGTGRKRKA
jgi:hypothetical protein